MYTDRQLAWTRLARAQHGVISYRQLVACRLSFDEVDTLVAQSILIRCHRGVYQVAPAPQSFEASLWIAVLATRGVLGSTSAAYLWGMLDRHDTPIQVIVARGRRVLVPPGVRVLRRDVDPASVSTRYRLPVTDRATAALDHLVSLRRPAATAFADRALQCGWLDPGDLSNRLAHPHRGNGLLRKVVATLVRGAEAESERILHRLLRAHGIAGWQANYQLRVNGTVRARIDLAFPAQRIAIEVDGFAYHSDRDRFQRDRTRQNELMLLGWTVLRFTWDDLTRRPAQVIEQIERAMRAAA